jgi:hypothetical protein
LLSTDQSWLAAHLKGERPLGAEVDNQMGCTSPIAWMSAINRTDACRRVPCATSRRCSQDASAKATSSRQSIRTGRVVVPRHGRQNRLGPSQLVTEVGPHQQRVAHCRKPTTPHPSRANQQCRSRPEPEDGLRCDAPMLRQAAAARLSSRR